MGFTLTTRDLSRLEGLEPGLRQTVIDAAAISMVPFMVVEGLRSDEQCYINFGKGRTVAQLTAARVPNPERYAKPRLAKVTWLSDPLNSKHRRQADGFGHAVDLLPAPYDWKDIRPFDLMAQAMLKAAAIRRVMLRWGANWDGDGKLREKGETDSPHFEVD